MELHLSPSEVAKRFGLSIKALRHYESCGLLAPKRTSNGSTGSAWRVYGPDQVARLHQILALKRLGLSLARIGEILAGPDKLVAVLSLQEQALTRQGDQLTRALILVRAAQAKLKAGQTLSIDDLVNLNQETVVTKLTDQQRHDLMKPIIDDIFSAQDLEWLKQRPHDQVAAKAQWDGLIAEAKSFMAVNADPASPGVQDLARRWNDQVRKFTGDNPELRDKVRQVWKAAMAEPRMAPELPVTPELFAFIGKALAHLKEAHPKNRPPAAEGG